MNSCQWSIVVKKRFFKLLLYIGHVLNLRHHKLWDIHLYKFESSSHNGTSPPSGDHSRFWLSCLGSLVFLLLNTFKLSGFLIFWYWVIWWRLIQKRVVHSKSDIYVFIIPKPISFPLIVLEIFFINLPITTGEFYWSGRVVTEE